MKLEQLLQPIQLILSDVDGVLTDGSLVFDNQGIESKTFHARDGMGIKLWQKSGRRFGLLTARSSHIVKVRAAELGIELVRQGFSDKLPAARQLFRELDMTPEQVCYIGDDLTDLAVIEAVGLGVAVADAVPEVKAAAKHTTKAVGGRGAVRELVEMILKGQNRWDELIQAYRST